MFPFKKLNNLINKGHQSSLTTINGGKKSGFNALSENLIYDKLKTDTICWSCDIDFPKTNSLFWSHTNNILALETHRPTNWFGCE